MKFLRICKVRCKKCGDVLGQEYEHPNESGGPMELCSCGAVGFDPDPVVWRIMGERDACETLFEIAEKETERLNFADVVDGCHLFSEGEIKKLYEIAVKLDPADLLRLVQHSDNSEERRFYAYIADMNLKRAQKEVVRKNLF